MSIESKVIKRDKMFMDSTDDIFDEIILTLEAIAEFLDIPMIAIDWKSVELDGKILIFTLNAELVEEDVEDEDDVSFIMNSDDSTIARKITVGIPVNVIDMNNKDVILDFLTDVEDSKFYREGRNTSSTQKPDKNQSKIIFEFLNSNTKKRTIH